MREGSQLSPLRGRPAGHAACHHGTSCLQLRPFEREHLPLVEPWFADAATQRWLGGPAWPAADARPRRPTTWRPAPARAAHHCHFVVLAWTPGWAWPPEPRRSELESRITGHVLARGELVATYQRA
jgi:hypothetical protein